MRKQGVFIGVLLGIWLLSVSAYANMVDANAVKSVHKGATIGCTSCHPEGNFRGLNSYGQAYKEAGRNAAAIETIDTADSDGDGMSNADEIEAGTNPGDAENK
jgi:hypothetical protein